MGIAARTETADRPTPPIYLNQKRAKRMLAVPIFSPPAEAAFSNLL
jgi:hypothetical protein